MSMCMDKGSMLLTQREKVLAIKGTLVTAQRAMAEWLKDGGLPQGPGWGAPLRALPIEKIELAVDSMDDKLSKLDEDLAELAAASAAPEKSAETAGAEERRSASGSADVAGQPSKKAKTS